MDEKVIELTLLLDELSSQLTPEENIVFLNEVQDQLDYRINQAEERR